MLVRSKFFPQFVEKIEKLKLSLSKQRNKMLKMRSEMLKTRKKGKTIKLEKNYREILPEISRIPGIPRIFENPLPISREVENPGKRETLIVAAKFKNQMSPAENITQSMRPAVIWQ